MLPEKLLLPVSSGPPHHFSAGAAGGWLSCMEEWGGCPKAHSGQLAPLREHSSRGEGAWETGMASSSDALGSQSGRERALRCEHVVPRACGTPGLSQGSEPWGGQYGLHGGTARV